MHRCQCRWGWIFSVGGEPAGVKGLDGPEKEEVYQSFIRIIQKCPFRHGRRHCGQVVFVPGLNRFCQVVMIGFHAPKTLDSDSNAKLSVSSHTEL